MNDVYNVNLMSITEELFREVGEIYDINSKMIYIWFTSQTVVGYKPQMSCSACEISTLPYGYEIKLLSSVKNRNHLSIPGF